MHHLYTHMLCVCVYPSHLILCDELALPECVWHVVD